MSAPQAPEERIGQDFSLSFVAANLVSFPIFCVAFVLVLALHDLVHPSFTLQASFLGFSGLVAGLLILPGVLAHEALHGVGFLMAGAPRASLRFGVDRKTLTPFAHCETALPARRLRIAIALPAIVLGILPAALGIALDLSGFTLFGALFTAAAAGDFLVLWLIRKVPAHALLAVHPERVGCVLPETEATRPRS